MPRPVRDTAAALQNAANWAANILAEIDQGRGIQVKADIKRLLAGDWGGLEFRLKPEEPESTPDAEIQN